MAGWFLVKKNLSVILIKPLEREIMDDGGTPTVGECLETLEVPVGDLEGCNGDIKEEFRIVKKVYFKRILKW